MHFPIAATGVGEAYPGEVENFVDEDAFEVAGVGQNFAIQQD
jgi:hypothetical protein